MSLPLSKLAVPALSAALVIVLAVPAFAQVGDFRIDSRVYRQGEEELEEVSHNVTLFQGNVIYDFTLLPEGEGEGEVAVLNLATARLLLMDPERKVLTSFDAARLEEVVAEIDRRALRSDSMLIRFLADPHFGETYNAQDQRLTLAAQEASYCVLGQSAPSPELVARYADFADWYAKANYTRPGALPVTARMTLNRTLVSHGLIPQQVQLEFRLDTGERVRMQSTHDYTWQLNEGDQEWISWARELAGSLREVLPDEYHGL